MKEVSVTERCCGLKFRQVDVFTDNSLSGNGLAVFWDSTGLSKGLMQRLTQELRQFESIFLTPIDGRKSFRASIFTMEEELDFAGHPILGASAVLHEIHGTEATEMWTFVLNSKNVEVTSTRVAKGYRAVMDQGAPEFGEPLTDEQAHPFLSALHVSPGHLAPDYPLQVVSTGLPYLIVPVRAGLEQVKIVHPAFESLLMTIGAKFAYVLDIHAREGRTWDNGGRVEDIATGSAAGPAGAYLCRYGLAKTAEPIVLHQGRFLDRPSEIEVRIRGNTGRIESVFVGGSVKMIATGVFD